MPKVPQSLPDSSSQKRDRFEYRVLRQSRSAVLMVMLAGGVGVDAGEDAAEGTGAGVTGRVAVWALAQRSKQASRSAPSVAMAAHRCQPLALVASGAWAPATVADSSAPAASAWASANRAACAGRRGKKCW